MSVRGTWDGGPGDLVDDPETKLFENIPMKLNLDDYEVRNYLGKASAFKNNETGAIRLDIRLSPEVSERMGHMLAEILDIKAIGFAGMRKDPTGE